MDRGAAVHAFPMAVALSLCLATPLADAAQPSADGGTNGPVLADSRNVLAHPLPNDGKDAAAQEAPDKRQAAMRLLFFLELLRSKP